MLKLLILAALAFSIAAFVPASTHQCQEMREQTIGPLQNVVAFLSSQPKMETMAGAGCFYLLHQISRVPSGAQLMRQLGARGVENAESRCTTVVNSIRYQCPALVDGRPRCYPEAYFYCGQWTYSMTSQPKYELGMELSTRLEYAYDRAQQLCAAALNWDEATTKSRMRELLGYLEERVLPRNGRFYDLACGG